MSKNCNKCNLNKSLNDFAACKRNKDGLQYYCKDCVRTYNKEYDRRPDRIVYKQKYYQKHADSKKEYAARKLYNLSLEEYNGIKARKKCDICETIDSGKRDFHIDHCHKTGKIRGLLCQKCNRALGLLKDDLNVIKRAKEYLEK